VSWCTYIFVSRIKAGLRKKRCSCAERKSIDLLSNDSNTMINWRNQKNIHSWIFRRLRHKGLLGYWSSLSLGFGKRKAWISQFFGFKGRIRSFFGIIGCYRSLTTLLINLWWGTYLVDSQHMASSPLYTSYIV